MKETYLKINNVDDVNGQTDVVKMILDQNYSILGDEFRKIVVNRFIMERERGTIEQKNGINDFEIDVNSTEKGPKIWNEKSYNGGISMSTTLQGKNIFNGEELLFLNRVAFLLLSEYGSNLKFKQFIDTLKIL